MIWAVLLPSFVLLLDFVLRRCFDLPAGGTVSDMVPASNRFVLRSICFALVGAFMTTSSTLPSITEDWMYESVGDGNPSFPFWWLVTTVAVAAVIGGNLYLFIYRRYVIGNSLPPDA